MLLYVDQVCPVELQCEFRRRFPCCLTAVVNYFTIRCKHHFPAGLNKPITPIDIIPVDKERLIHHSHTLDGFHPDEGKAADDHVYFTGLIVLPAGIQFSTKKPALRKQPAEEESVEEHVKR